MLNPVQDFQDFLRANTPQGTELSSGQIDEYRRLWMDRFIQGHGRQGDAAYNKQIRTQLEIAVPSARNFPDRYTTPQTGTGSNGEEVFRPGKPSPFLEAARAVPQESPFKSEPRAVPSFVEPPSEPPVKRSILPIRLLETAKDTAVGTIAGLGKGLTALGEFVGDTISFGERVLTGNNFGGGENITEDGRSRGYGLGIGNKTARLFEWLSGGIDGAKDFLYSDELKEDQRIAAERLRDRGFRSAAGYYLAKPHLLFELAGNSVGQAGAVALTAVATGGTGVAAKVGQLGQGAKTMATNRVTFAKGLGNLTNKPLVRATADRVKDAAPYAAIWAVQLSQIEGNEAYNIVKEMDLAELEGTAGYNEARAILRRRLGHEPTSEQVRELAARTVESSTEKFSGAATFAAMLLPGGAFLERGLGKVATAIPGGRAAVGAATRPAQTLSRTPRWKRALRAGSREFVSEGAEEAGQFAAIEGAVNSLVDGRGALSSQLDALTSDQALDTALLGGTIGALFGGLLGARRDEYNKFADNIDKELQRTSGQGEAAKARAFTGAVDQFNTYVRNADNVDPGVQAATVYAEGQRALNTLGLTKDERANQYLLEKAYGERNLEKPDTGIVPTNEPLGELERTDLEEAHDNDPEIYAAFNLQHGRVSALVEGAYNVKVPDDSRYGADAVHQSWARQLDGPVLYSNPDWALVVDGDTVTRITRTTGQRAETDANDPLIQGIMAGTTLSEDTDTQGTEDAAVAEAADQGLAPPIDYTADIPHPSPFLQQPLEQAPAIDPVFALQTAQEYEAAEGINGGVEAVRLYGTENVRKADQFAAVTGGQVVFLNADQLAAVSNQPDIDFPADANNPLPRSSRQVATATLRRLTTGQTVAEVPKIGTGKVSEQFPDLLEGELSMKDLGYLKGINHVNQQAIARGEPAPYPEVPVLLTVSEDFELADQTDINNPNFKDQFPEFIQLGDVQIPFPVQRLDLGSPDDIDADYLSFVPEPRALNDGASISTFTGHIEDVAENTLDLSPLDLGGMSLQLKAEAISQAKENPLTHEQITSHLAGRTVFAMPTMPSLEVVNTEADLDPAIGPVVGGATFVNDSTGRRRFVVVADRFDSTRDLDYQVNSLISSNNLLADIVGPTRAHQIHTPLLSSSNAEIREIYDTVNKKYSGLSTDVRSGIAARLVMTREQRRMREHKEAQEGKKKPAPYVPQKDVEAFVSELRTELEKDGWIAEGMDHASVVRGFTKLFGLTREESKEISANATLGSAMIYGSEGGGGGGNGPSGRALYDTDSSIAAYSIKDKGERRLIWESLRQWQMPAIQEYQFLFGGKVAVERVARFLSQGGVNNSFLEDYSLLRARVRQQRDENYGTYIKPIKTAIDNAYHRGVPAAAGVEGVQALKSDPRYEGSDGYARLRKDIHDIAVYRHAPERNVMLRLTRVILKSEHRDEMKELITDIELGRRSRAAILQDLNELTADENVDWKATAKKLGLKPRGKGRKAKEAMVAEAQRLSRQLSGISTEQATENLEIMRNRHPVAADVIENNILPLVYEARQAELQVNGRNLYGEKGLRTIEFYGWENSIPLKDKNETTSISEFTGRPQYDPSTRDNQTASGRTGRNDGRITEADQLRDIVDALETDMELASIRNGSNEFYRAVYNTGTSSELARRAFSMTTGPVDQEAVYEPGIGDYVVPQLATGDGKMAFFVDGKSTQFNISDQNLKDAFLELWNTGMPRATGNATSDFMIGGLRRIGAVTRLKGSLVTKYNPFFVTPAAVRDITQTVGFNYAQDKDLGRRVASLIANRKLMAATWKIHQARPEQRRQIVAEMRQDPDREIQLLAERYAEGGPANFAVIFDRKEENISPEREQFESGTQRRIAGLLPPLAREKLGSAEDWISNAHNAADNFHRNAMYIARRERGEDVKTAGRLANELIDWGQQSAAGQALSHAFMFSQPALTGAHATFWRWMWKDFNPPVDFRIDQNGNQIPFIDLQENWNKLNIPLIKLQSAISATTYAARVFVLAGLAGAVLGDDDADKKAREIPDYIWASNFAVIPAPGDTNFVIPSQYGPQQLINAATVLSMRVMLGHTTLESASDAMADAVLANLTPISPAQGDGAAATVLNTATPDILKTVSQLAQNRNAFGGVIRGDNPFNPRFGSDAAFFGTPEGWQNLSENIRTVSGVDWSPESLRFVAQQEFGPLGSITARLMEVTDAKTRDPGAWLRLQPFVRTERSGEYSEARHLAEQTKRLDEYKKVRAARKAYDVKHGTNTEAQFVERNQAYQEAVRLQRRFLRERKAARNEVERAAANLSQNGSTQANRQALMEAMHKVRRLTEDAATEMEALLNRQPHVRLR